MILFYFFIKVFNLFLFFSKKNFVSTFKLKNGAPSVIQRLKWPFI